MREELGADVEVCALVASIENLFTYEGEAWHDLCLVYACSLRDKGLYSLDAWKAEEMTPSGPITHLVSW